MAAFPAHVLDRVRMEAAAPPLAAAGGRAYFKAEGMRA
jgi:hypothetical protein